MAKRKYSDEKAIKEKIQELFAYRKLTDLLQISQLVKDKTFTHQLLEIQLQIYLLDAYLESQWHLTKEELESYWTAIKTALAKLDYAEKQIETLIQEIKDYERIEKNCRKDKWPTDESFRKFYTTKSCDVRLIRHLIYKACPQLNLIWKEKAWVFYDCITEINDDIADVEEDLHTYNGNRFLISIIRKGSEKTSKQYRKYLTDVTAKAKDYFKHHPPESKNRQLYDWTMLRSRETLQLLEQTMTNHDPEIFTTSLLLEHMK